jgi:predicted O-linked N-acetylglucosamine transferase (SPINDLY family)
MLPLPIKSNGYVTFGCLNNFAKVSDPALDVWAKLLSIVPLSRLLLHVHAGSQRNRVIHALRRAAVSADRVEFIEMLPVADYLRTYHRIDVALDPFPYNGGTTTCDALWMGVPVVTLAGAGDVPVRRAGASLLNQVGLPHLVAATTEAMTETAARCVADADALARLRLGLRERMRASPLCDADGFTRAMESAYRRMWVDWTEANRG